MASRSRRSVDADPTASSARPCTASIVRAHRRPARASPREHGIAIGIIATPAVAAQDVADRLVAAGVPSILNFAPTVISVPEEVSLRKVDLAVELQILSFYQQRQGRRVRTGPALADAAHTASD